MYANQNERRVFAVFLIMLAGYVLWALTIAPMYGQEATPEAEPTDDCPYQLWWDGIVEIRAEWEILVDLYQGASTETARERVGDDMDDLIDTVRQIDPDQDWMPLCVRFPVLEFEYSLIGQREAIDLQSEDFARAILNIRLAERSWGRVEGWFMAKGIELDVDRTP